MTEPIYLSPPPCLISREQHELKVLSNKGQLVVICQHCNEKFFLVSSKVLKVMAAIGGFNLEVPDIQ